MRKLLIAVYVAIACVPGIAMLAHVKDHRLEGSFAPAPRPELTFASVRSEDYQDKFTAWFERGLGFRAWEIWADNSALYYLFRETKWGSHVAIGNDRVLFERDDINFFNKSDDALPKPAAVTQLAADIAALQERLARDHKALVPIFIPSKTTFYRDKVPSRWTRDLGDPRPAQLAIVEPLKRELDRRGVKYVDGIALLMGAKTPREQLWGRDARHFSALSGCLADQAILGRYSELTGRAPIPYPCETKKVTARRDHVDLDLFRLLNAFGVGRITTAHDIVHPDVPRALDAPNAMWISSSFGWMMEIDAVQSHRFNELHMDYYNRTLYQDGKDGSVEVKAHTPEWRAVFLTRDLYVLELNETYITPGDFFGSDAVRAILEDLR